MIFNPLFLQDSLPNKMLGTKQEKLAGNKYLFADIVNVVMNPDGSKTNPTAMPENIQSLDIESLFTSGMNLKQLKEKIISDLEGIENIDELIDILPPEIAQLLLNAGSSENQEAVSYLSNEPLKGELKEFLDKLLGKDFIDENLSKESGLLLNLEDKKSAVNVELVQENQKGNGEGKVIVQTLVVPEKSKLVSLLKNQENVELQNIKNIQAVKNPVDKEQFNLKTNNIVPTNGESSNLETAENNKESTKPTLSLFSFKPATEKAVANSKGVKLPTDIQKNTDATRENIKELNIITSKISLAKLKVVQKEGATSENVKVENPKVKTETKETAELKVVEQNSEKKDFMINKITILKKESPQTELENQVKDKNVYTALKRINFSKEMLKGETTNKDSKEVNVNKEAEPKTETEKELSLEKLKVLSKEMLKGETKITENDKGIKSNKNVQVKSEQEKENIKVVESNNKAPLKVKTENQSEIKIEESSKLSESSNSQEETDTNSKNHSENNNSSKNSYINNLQHEKPHIPEAKFHHALTREEKIATGMINANDSEDIQKEQTEKTVKSIELIKEATKFITRQEKGILTLSIRPEHLGKMKITLDTVDDAVKAKIEVDTEAAKHIVEKNMDRLQQDLNQNGIKVSSLDISLSNPKERKGEEAFEENTPNFNGNAESNNESIKEEEAKDKKSMGYNTYEYIA